MKTNNLILLGALAAGAVLLMKGGTKSEQTAGQASATWAASDGTTTAASSTAAWEKKSLGSSQVWAKDTGNTTAVVKAWEPPAATSTYTYVDAATGNKTQVSPIVASVISGGKIALPTGGTTTAGGNGSTITKIGGATIETNKQGNVKVTEGKGASKVQTLYFPKK